MLKRSLAAVLIILTCLTAFPFVSFSAANGTGFYQVTASSLNVRASASSSSAIVGGLSNGDLITVTEISGNWGKTAVDSVTGWVSLNYCNRLFYITFDANGGKGAPEAMLIADGNSIAVPSEIPTLTGKTFKGWSTSLANANEGIVSYSAKGSLGGSSYIAPTSDITLYACWAETTVSDPETDVNTDSTINPKLSGETSRVVKELYDGVVSTKIKTSSSSKYDLQSFNVIEFDLSQTDLYLDVTNTRTYANQLKTVSETVKSFNSSNGEGKTAVAAVNGDLWMTTYAHSRVEGSGTSYGGYSDAVVTSGLTLPRGFNVYDGEIICSAYMQQETPYEGEFWSFGITDDYVPMIGCPELEIKITDTTKNLTASADGLNRLPANNALVVYSDKGCLNNYALSDAYEIAIDCDYDYTVAHGAKITGKIVGIYSSSSSSNPSMKANRIILTARGTAVSLINKFALGDTVTLDFSVTERYGRNSDGWQNVTNAVGGHMPFVVDGVKRETGTTTNYPTTIIGIKNDGSLCFIANDGRQTSFSTGLDFNMYWDLADDFDLNTAFILDGGGSTAMVELDGAQYNLVNSPSDGSERTVVNSVILSYGPKREEQGNFEVKIPDADIDLTKLFFATDEDYALIAGLNESVSSQTASGARLTVKDFYSSPGVVISYGLPNTSSYNPNSVLADIEYPTVDASDYPYVVFDMSVVSADKSIVQFQTLYTTTGSRKGISQDTFIGFNNAYNNNGYNLYTLNPGANATFKGKLNSFHFGFFFPANGVTVKDGDYIILRSVRLAKTANEAAAMTAVNASTLKFNANGGSVDRTLKYVISGRNYGTLPVPTREGYKFDGWFTAASGGTQVTSETAVNHSGVKNLYAHWTSEHVHSWSEWSTEVAPTCVDIGTERRNCTSCTEFETRSIPATGVHFWGTWNTVNDALCETEGSEERSCSVCNKTETRTVNALGHDYSSKVIDPTCTEKGYTEYICNICGYGYKDDYNDEKGHSYGQWILDEEPTCVLEGKEKRVCENCDAFEIRPVSATGVHVWGAWNTVKAALCEADGSEERACDLCGLTESRVLYAIGHDLVHHEANYENCPGAGWDEYDTCTRCDYSTFVEIPTLGHDYVPEVIEPTCTEKGYTQYICKNCGNGYKDSYTEAAGHDYGAWVTVTAAGCESNGEERRVCAVCNDTETNVIYATGHDMGEWIVTTDPTCVLNGVQAKYCADCNAVETQSIPATGHEYETTVTDPTCTSGGYTVYTCFCGNSYKDEETPAAGHSFGDWEVTAAAGCVTEGEEKRICESCGVTETQVIPASGEHTWGEWIITDTPTMVSTGEQIRRCENCDAAETEEIAKLEMNNPFTDVKEGKWYTEGILWCVGKGYMAGMSETVFGYKETVTRAMFATILAKIDGADTSSYTEMSFTDVKPGQWYSNAIEWAASNGYAAGLGQGIFGYKQNVTREQLAMFLYTYSEKNAISVTRRADLEGYSDYGRIHEYALEALSWAVKEELISGTSETTLAPRDSATRAEIALIVKNYVENVKEAKIVTEGTDSGIVRDGTPKKYFTLSFDDGITQDAKIIEILKKYDVDCCTFNINTGLYGVDWPAVGVSLGRPDITHTRYTEEELMTGIYDGYDVEVHTLHHPALGDYDSNPEYIIDQVATDAANIEKITGRTPVGMAWPGGDAFYTDKTVEIIMENTGIRFARGTTSTFGFELPEYFMKWLPTCSVSDPLVLEYAKTFLRTPCTEDMLFYVWGHGYEFDFYHSYDTFEALIKMISEADDVVLVTNAEFYQLFKDEIPSWK